MQYLRDFETIFKYVGLPVRSLVGFKGSVLFPMDT